LLYWTSWHIPDVFDNVPEKVDNHFFRLQTPCWRFRSLSFAEFPSRKSTQLPKIAKHLQYTSDRWPVLWSVSKNRHLPKMGWCFFEMTSRIATPSLVSKGVAKRDTLFKTKSTIHVAFLKNLTAWTLETWTSYPLTEPVTGNRWISFARRCCKVE